MHTVGGYCDLVTQSTLTSSGGVNVSPRKPHAAQLDTAKRRVPAPATAYRRQGSWPAADGRGRGVLNRHPHSGFRNDQGAAAGFLGLLAEHLNHCVVDAARTGGREAGEKTMEASDAIARLVRS